MPDLRNIIFIENSFSDLAAGKVDLPKFDFITMHGVYTWVSPENRQHIIDIIFRYLKPGGVVYVSYNALPGWASAIPVRRLACLIAELNIGLNSLQHIDIFKIFIKNIIDANSEYFLKNNNSLGPHLNTLENCDSSYLAHEYLHDEWSALYHADVVNDFSRAKLEYLCSAELTSNFHELPPAQQQIVDSISDPVWARTIKDFMLNTEFRKDIFVRGRKPILNYQKTEWLQRCTLALTGARENTNVPGLENNSLSVEFLDALAESPRHLEELIQLPLFDGKLDKVKKISASIIDRWLGSIFIKNKTEVDPEPSRRLNRELARRAHLADKNYGVFASPLTGNGLETSLIGRLVYFYLSDNPSEGNAKIISEWIWNLLKNQAQEMENDGDICPLQLSFDDVLSRVNRTLRVGVPLWKQHQII
jgi:SAM-dependent methyltransferase